MTKDNINDTIKDYMPFIVKTVADYTKRYVEVENSEELSIAIEAFYEGRESYDSQKGAFISYVKKVIINRLIDYSRKKKKVIYVELDENHITDRGFEEDVAVKDELSQYELELNKFNISYDILVDKSPKHRKTRQRVYSVGIKIGENKELMGEIYKKRFLPITKISQLYDLSIKVVKSHKLTIIAVAIAYYKDVTSITQWIDNIMERGFEDEKRFNS